MKTKQNRSTTIKLFVVLSLFVGLMVGLIVYEVRQYILAQEQRENFESFRKNQFKNLNNALKESMQTQDKDSFKSKSADTLKN